MATIMTIKHCLNARLVSTFASRSSLPAVVTARSITRAKHSEPHVHKPSVSRRSFQAANILRQERKPTQKGHSTPSGGQTRPSAHPAIDVAKLVEDLEQNLTDLEKAATQIQLRAIRTRRCTIITWTFIGVCVFITLTWQSIIANANSPERLQADPDLYKRLEISWQILCYLFTFKEDQPNPLFGLGAAISHREFMHLGVNMLAFHAFASIFKHYRIANSAIKSAIPISSAIAPRHLFGIMLASALLCNAAQKLEWAMTSNEGRPRSALGASGVVSGLGMAMALLTPNTEIMLMLVPMPLALAVVGLAAYDLFYLARQKDSVSHSGHLGGFVGGALYYMLFMRKVSTLTAMKLMK